MTLLRRLLVTLIAVGTVPTVVVALWATWERTRDPRSAIDPGSIETTVVQDNAYAVGRRRYHDVVLYSPEVDSVRCTISLPDDSSRALPVIIIIGGLEIGRTSLGYVAEHGANAVIAYEYPYGPRYWYEGAPMTEIPAIRRAVISVPGQLAALLRHASRQPWADSARSVCFSYSFGAIFAPSFLRLAESYGDTVHHTTLVYGGADIERLLQHNLRIESSELRNIFAWFAATAIHVVEPENHLPYLHSMFLVMNGKRDQFIPAMLSQRIRALVPEPKTVRILDTEHMQPGARHLIDTLVAISRDWLVRQGAMNR